MTRAEDIGSMQRPSIALYQPQATRCQFHFYSRKCLEKRLMYRIITLAARSGESLGPAGNKHTCMGLQRVYNQIMTRCPNGAVAEDDCRSFRIASVRLRCRLPLFSLFASSSLALPKNQVFRTAGGNESFNSQCHHRDDGRGRRSRLSRQQRHHRPNQQPSRRVALFSARPRRRTHATLREQPHARPPRHQAHPPRPAQPSGPHAFLQRRPRKGLVGLRRRHMLV